MRALIAENWKDRLPSALAALGFHAALFAAFIYSFTAITHAPEQETETIFLLPRLAPVPPSDPVVIDARSAAPRGAPTTNQLPSSLPSYAAPDFTLPGAPASDNAILATLGRGTECRPDADGRPSPLCGRDVTPQNPHTVTINPRSHVQQEGRWAQDKARADAPLTLPGGNPLGILITALTNPSAFLDKRNYKPVPLPKGSKMSGAEYQALGRYTNPQCPPGMGSERQSCAASAGALEGMRYPIAASP